MVQSHEFALACINSTHTLRYKQYGSRLQVAHSAFCAADSQHVPPHFHFLLGGGGGNNNSKHRKGYNVTSSDLAIPTIWQNITAGNLQNLVQKYALQVAYERLTNGHLRNKKEHIIKTLNLVFLRKQRSFPSSTIEKKKEALNPFPTI